MELLSINYSLALEILNQSKFGGVESSISRYQLYEKSFINDKVFAPVLFDYFNGILNPILAYKNLFKNLIKELKKVEKIDWSEIGVYLGSENLFMVLNHLKKDISDKDYWVALGECYTMSTFSNSEYRVLKKYFEADRPDRLFIMTESERKVFDSFPDEIKIYRGCSIKEKKSGKYRFSWTTKESVADFFANRNKNLFDIETTVVTLVVKKEEVFAYFDRREESEIIYLHQK